MQCNYAGSALLVVLANHKGAHNFAYAPLLQRQRRLYLEAHVGLHARSIGSEVCALMIATKAAEALHAWCSGMKSNDLHSAISIASAVVGEAGCGDGV